MKDQLDPLASESAAYLNQLELAQLDDLGSVAQRILGLMTSMGPILVSSLPDLPGPLMSLLGGLSKKISDKALASEQVNVETFAYLVVRDLQRLEKVLAGQGRKIDDLFGSQKNVEILIHGARRARYANVDKIRRLARVVVTGVASVDDSDEKVLEFLRFATDLNETDICVLNELYKLQQSFDPKFPDLWTDNVRRAMNNRSIVDQSGSPMNDQYVRSAYARLQALGLVTQIGATSSRNSPSEQPYAILKLGREFLQYLTNEEEHA